jgi:hypothetical protein
MTLLAWLMAVALCAIAVLHVYWGVGGLWPGTDATSLARTVVGARGIARMPPLAACLFVAVALIGMGYIVLELADLAPLLVPEPLLSFVGIGCAGVFLVRGLTAYVPTWRRLVPEEPFASLDRHLYGPLCLALGSGFIVLLLKGLV